MIDFCFLLWISVLSCKPVAQNYLDAASAVPPEHLALVHKIEITRADHAYATYARGRISLPARRDEKLLYNFTHEVGHLVFEADDEELISRWALRFWWNGGPIGQISNPQPPGRRQVLRILLRHKRHRGGQLLPPKDTASPLPPGLQREFTTELSCL